MREYLSGSNDQRPAWACLLADDYMANTDVLTIRRASSSPVPDAALNPGALYVRSNTAPRSQLFVGGTPIPAGLGPTAQNFEVIARAYYVRPWSIGFGTNDNIPSLRRLELTETGGQLSVRDLEVVQGIENVQFQFGIDTNDDQAVDAYVNADNPLLAPGTTNSVLSVRVWVLVRSETPETGYVSDESFQMGDITVPAANDNFRRTMVTRTVVLRNRV
jgi:type IV pilus assembly protein PilW